MRKTFFLLSLIALVTSLRAQDKPGYTYVNATSLTVMGRPASVLPQSFHRIDTSLLSKVPSRVAELATNSAGICVSFRSNSKSISLKWQLGKYNNLWNMTPLAVNGLDLYGWNNGQWQYVASARPQADSNQVELISGLDGGERNYRLYLPLYAEVKSLEIGVDAGAAIHQIAPDLLPKKKLVIYGSSITQGASASRPGMAYPSILSRGLNIETFNMGFSGSGKMELVMADVIAAMDADVYILDCVPNPSPAEIKERAIPFIKRLRELRPQTPVIMVESIIREQSYWSESTRRRVGEQNQEFRKAFEQLLKEKFKNLYYIDARDLTGHDHEATIDGTHLTDVGFQRMAGVIGHRLKKIL